MRRHKWRKLKHKLIDLHKHTEGQALVEFALTASMTMLIIIGGITLTQVYAQKSIIDDAARQAARAYSIEAVSNPAAARTDAALIATNTLQANGLSLTNIQSINLQQSTINGQPSETCSISYNYHTNIALVQAVMGSIINLKAYAQFPQEPT